MLKLVFLLSICMFTAADVEVGSRHYNKCNDPYRTSYGSYSYYNQYNLPYTIYSFCNQNYYLVCDPARLGDFCVTYETTCGYTARLTVIPRTYYYVLLNNYCPTWCASCGANYQSLCSATTTTSTSTTSTATTTTTAVPTTTTTTTIPTTTTTTSTTTTTVPTTTSTTTTVPTTTTTASPTTKCEYSDYQNVTIGRIFSGSAAYQCEYPSMVALKPDFSDPTLQIPPICNGVLVKANTVVTSVECVDRLSAFGSSNIATVGEYFWLVDEPADESLGATVTKIDQNSGLATLTLASSPTFNKCVAPACLASSDSTISVDKTNCKLTGWGQTDSASGPANILMQGDVTISTSSECSSMITTIGALRPALVPFNDTASIGCTSVSQSEASACAGDEGGAVTCAESTTGEQILVGIIRSGGCDTLKETFFTDLSSTDAASFLASI